MKYRYEIRTKENPEWHPAELYSHCRLRDAAGNGFTMNSQLEGIAWRRPQWPAPMDGRWSKNGDLESVHGYTPLVQQACYRNELRIHAKAVELDKAACMRILRGWSRGKTVQQAHEDGGRDE